MRILVVEDERRLADALTQIMREQKYTVDAVYDGEDGYQYALAGDYDAVILDVMLPKRNGYDVVRALRREKNATPVLMLTARDELESKVTGLDCGADDYMTKPFAPEELTARIRALTRRQGEVFLEEMAYEDIILELASSDLRCGALLRNDDQRLTPLAPVSTASSTSAGANIGSEAAGAGYASFR